LPRASVNLQEAENPNDPKKPLELRGFFIFVSDSKNGSNQLKNAHQEHSARRFILGAILVSIALITTFAAVEVLTQNQSIVLFALTMFAFLFYRMTRRLR
jgi:hypothetical protein